MKKRTARFLLNWRLFGFVIVALAIAAGLFIFRLRSLEPILSTEEAAGSRSISLTALIHNPLDFVWKLLSVANHHLLFSQTALAARLPSVVLGLVAVGLILYILYHWYGPRSMIFGFFLFTCSAWTLHIVRFGGPEVDALVMILAVLAAHLFIHNHENDGWALYVWVFIQSVTIFTPGLLWFVAVSAGLQWRTLLHAWRALGPLWNRLLCSMVAICCIGIVAYSIIAGSATWQHWAGLSATLPAWRNIPSAFLTTIEVFIWQGPNLPELWLGRLPLFDIFTFVMLLVGIAFYARHWAASRTRLLGSYLLLGIALASLGPQTNVSFLVPVVYLIAVAGIAFVLHRWLAVFPRNPLARGFGIGFIGCLVGLVCLYNCVQYFVAWPHNPTTKTAYADTKQP